MDEADQQRLYALLPSGAERIHLDPFPDPFYSLYKTVKPGIYEAARTYETGRIFGFEMHQERMEAGMQATGFKGSLTEQELRRSLQQAVDEFPSSSIKVRWDLCPEPYTPLNTEAHMIATLVPREPVPDWVSAEGVSLSLTTELQRKIPTTKGAAFALERSRFTLGTYENYEPVMVDPDGYLLEGVMSNFGAILDGRLHTNPKKVLPGITIRTLLKLAEHSGLEVVHEPIHRRDLHRIEEAFLCSSVRGLVCATRIDGTIIGSGKPGPRLAELAAAYMSHAESSARRLWPL
ncbi:MAG: branched-subunit amino acid aminotransferase/4-amino-4-deoxychorismate lyase [Planctomycetota bacterium]|jgi:branched-subunit amino acid aminotransferase/4-amino-4-deoxychorismate lyase